jgi:ParB-like chromosome segregation protein Spo0J
MSNPNIMRIRITDIVVGDNRRSCNPESVQQLTTSMSAIGLKIPIVVRRVGDRDHLVAGLHRLEAAKVLGWDFIDATVMQGDDTDARMWEIAENLHRKDLTILERAEQEAEWVRLVEAKNAVSGQNVHKPQGGRPKGGVAKAARELPVRGKTQEAKRKALERSQTIAGIAPDAKSAVKAAHLDNNQSALIAVAKEPTPKDQLKKVHELNSHKKPRASRSKKSVTRRTRIRPGIALAQFMTAVDTLMPKMDAETKQQALAYVVEKAGVPPAKAEPSSAVAKNGESGKLKK